MCRQIPCAATRVPAAFCNPNGRSHPQRVHVDAQATVLAGAGEIDLGERVAEHVGRLRLDERPGRRPAPRQVLRPAVRELRAAPHTRRPPRRVRHSPRPARRRAGIRGCVVGHARRRRRSSGPRRRGLDHLVIGHPGLHQHAPVAASPSDERGRRERAARVPARRLDSAARAAPGRTRGTPPARPVGAASARCSTASVPTSTSAGGSAAVAASTSATVTRDSNAAISSRTRVTPGRRRAKRVPWQCRQTRGRLGPAPPAYESTLGLGDRRVADLAARDMPALPADEQAGAALAVHDTHGSPAPVHVRVERSGQRIGEQASPGRLVAQVDDVEARPAVALEPRGSVAAGGPAAASASSVGAGLTSVHRAPARRRARARARGRSTSAPAPPPAPRRPRRGRGPRRGRERARARRPARPRRPTRRRGRGPSSRCAARRDRVPRTAITSRPHRRDRRRAHARVASRARRRSWTPRSRPAPRRRSATRRVGGHASKPCRRVTSASTAAGSTPSGASRGGKTAVSTSGSPEAERRWAATPTGAATGAARRSATRPTGTARRPPGAGPPRRPWPAAAAPTSGFGLDAVGDDPAPHASAVQRDAHDGPDPRPMPASVVGHEVVEGARDSGEIRPDPADPRFGSWRALPPPCAGPRPRRCAPR